MVFDATPAGSAANSYVTVQEATDYFDLRMGTQAWADLTLGDKQKALCHATIQLDRLEFKGIRLTTTQVLEFPRYVVARDRPCQGWDVQFQYPSETIPEQVKRACCEEALWAIKYTAQGGTSKRQALQQEGVKSFSIGDFSETFGAASLAMVCPEAMRHLRIWIFKIGSVLDPREVQQARLRLSVINRGGIDCDD